MNASFVTLVRKIRSLHREGLTYKEIDIELDLARRGLRAYYIANSVRARKVK